MTGNLPDNDGRKYPYLSNKNTNSRTLHTCVRCPFLNYDNNRKRSNSKSYGGREHIPITVRIRYIWGHPNLELHDSNNVTLYFVAVHQIFPISVLSLFLGFYQRLFIVRSYVVIFPDYSDTTFFAVSDFCSYNRRLTRVMQR